jgi:hypothetical protein
MYITAEPDAVIAVKYAFPSNVRISSVFGRRGMLNWLLVTIRALLLASLLVDPWLRNATTVPVLMIRYWVPAMMRDTAWTGEGALVAAVKVTVFPIGVNA